MLTRNRHQKRLQMNPDDKLPEDKLSALEKDLLQFKAFQEEIAAQNPSSDPASQAAQNLVQDNAGSKLVWDKADLPARAPAPQEASEELQNNDDASQLAQPTFSQKLIPPSWFTHVKTTTNPATHGRMSYVALSQDATGAIIIATKHGNCIGQVMTIARDTDRRDSAANLVARMIRDQAGVVVDMDCPCGQDTADQLFHMGLRVDTFYAGVQCYRYQQSLDQKHSFHCMRDYVLWSMRELLSPEHYNGLVMVADQATKEALSAINYTVTPDKRVMVETPHQTFDRCAVLAQIPLAIALSLVGSKAHSTLFGNQEPEAMDTRQYKARASKSKSYIQRARAAAKRYRARTH